MCHDCRSPHPFGTPGACLSSDATVGKRLLEVPFAILNYIIVQQGRDRKILCYDCQNASEQFWAQAAGAHGAVQNGSLALGSGAVSPSVFS